MSKENKKLTQAFIPQLRKRDVDCYLTAQIPRLLDCRVKDMSDYYVFCEKKLYDSKTRKAISVQQSKHFKEDVAIIINLDIVNLATMKDLRRRFIANKYYRFYDTSEVIQVQALEDHDDKKKKVT